MNNLFIALITGLFIIPINVSCQVSSENDPATHTYLLNKVQVSKIRNHTIEFYLNNSQIDKYSKMYYRCEYAPSDDDITSGFLDSILTNNNETRPFYVFIFNQILKSADGGLAEIMSFKCLEYVSKYPCEFVKYGVNENFIDINNWIGQLIFTEYNDKNVKKIDDIEGYVRRTCPVYLEKWKETRKYIVKPEL